MLKTDIKKALDATSNVENKTPAELREEYAAALAAAVKAALRTWVTNAVVVPQDGGTSLKTTLLANIDSL